MKGLSSMNKRLSQFSVVALMLGLLSACGGSGMSDLEKFVASAYKDSKPEIEPLPEMKPFSAFAYSAYDMDDPFNVTNVIGEASTADTSSTLRPDANRPSEPLEAFPLDALRMVGTMIKDGTSWVVMQTTQGTAHFLKKGNYMGQNDGQIKEIDSEQQLVVLEETFLNSSNRWETREVELTVEE